MTPTTLRLSLLLVAAAAAACKDPILTKVDEVASPNERSCDPAAAASGLTATVSGARIDLAWTSGATGAYQLQVEMAREGVGFAEVARLGASARSWSDISATCTQPNTWCEYRVKAFTEQCATTPTPALRVYSVPAAPGAVTASTSGDGHTITVSWADPNAWESGYAVERAPVGTTDFAPLQSVGADATSVADAARPLDAGYTYRVRAFIDQGGARLHSDPVSVDGFTPPNAPGNLTATPVSAARVDLVWDDPNQHETGFRVERRTGGAAFAPIASLGPDATTYQDAALSELTTYEYAVVATGPGPESAPALATQRTLRLPQVAWNGAPALDAACNVSIPASVSFDPLIVAPALSAVTGTAGTLVDPAELTSGVTGLAGPLASTVRRSSPTSLTVVDRAGGATTLSRSLRLDFAQVYGAGTLAPQRPSATLGADAISGRQVIWPATFPPGVCSGCEGRRGSISLSANSSFVLSASGTVLGWGGNVAGELGDGTTLRRAYPAPVCAAGTAAACTPLTGVEAIAAGRNFACAVLSDGTARCWGANWNGQSGDGTTTTPRLNPVTVCASGADAGCAGGAALDRVVSVGAGTSHACAVRDDGSAWCWGNNLYGQLGDGTTTQRLNPVQVCASGSGAGCAGGAALTGVVAISGARYHSCAITSGGDVLCWGNNGAGQLGDGTTTQRLNPVKVCTSGAGADCAGGAALSGVVAIDLLRGDVATAVVEKSHAVLSSGAVYSWPDGGYHAAAVCYSGSACPASDPIGDAASVVVATKSVCVLRRSRTARCRGWGWLGELGNGLGTDSDAFVDVLLSDVVALATSADDHYPVGSLGGTRGPYGEPGHSCALTGAGGLHCWGSNLFGEVGNGSTSTVTSPDAGSTYVCNGCVLQPFEVCASGSGDLCPHLSGEALLTCGQLDLFPE